MAEQRAVIVVIHGSREEEANANAAKLVVQVRSRIFPATRVEAAFLSFGSPAVTDAIVTIAADGVQEILLLPYFLQNGNHVREDLPKLAAECAQRLAIRITVLPGLENDMRLEDLLVERIEREVALIDELPELGDEIEKRSHEMIEQRLAHTDWQEPSRSIVRRIIHSTADFSFAETLRIHPEAVACGIRALKCKAPIICDSTILLSGVTKTESELICLMRDPDVAARAKQEGTTRAVASMRTLAEKMNGAIIAIGNAPTALWEVMRLWKEEGVRPALVVGLPVGFVGARESKSALAACNDIPYITNISMRGGSPAAAATLNALAVLIRNVGKASI